MRLNGIIIETTNICNYNCIMCPNSKQTRYKGIMDWHTFKNIINAINKVKYINFNMLGESLFDKDLVKKINYARKIHKNARLMLHTNASLPISNLVNSPINEVIVSFYGHNKASYKKLHGIDNFDRVLENIKKIKSDKISIICNYIKGVNDPKKVEELFKGYRFMSYPIHTFAGGVDLEGQEKDCEIMKGILVFLWNGDVTTCCMDYDGKNVFGNINHKPLFEIMEDLKEKELPVCKTCSLGEMMK